MAGSRCKRTVYSDADVSTLVDLIYIYKDKVECKKTDMLTWKEKDAVWDKIRVDFNTGATEQRTTEQLRTKYDNLKKETRRYFAKQRQNLYRTGGGPIEDDIRGVLRDIYEKIKAIINMSVIGMEARPGDSDNIDSGSQSVPSTSAAFCESILVPPPNNEATIVDDQCSSINIDVISTPLQADSDKDCAVDDWSSYSPAMLKRKKHNILRVQKNTGTKHEHATKTLMEIGNSKIALLKLKKELLIKEDKRNEEFHKERLEGQRLLNEKLKLANEEKKLKNELLELEIKQVKQINM